MYRVTNIILLLILALSGLTMAQIPFSAYVVNTLGQNLSMINLENQMVDVNAEPLGLFTNQVVVHGENAYVVNSGANDIQVIDLNSLNTIQHIDVGSGTNPWNLDFVNDSIAVVTLLFTNQAVFVNVNSGQIVQTVPVGSGPEGVKYYNGKVYVTNTAFNGVGFDPGTVSVIDVNNYSVTTVDVGLNPQDLALDSQGRMVVCCTGPFDSLNAQIDFIDTNSETVVNTVPVGIQITSIEISSADKIYLGTFSSGVLVYDIASGVFERDVNNPLPGGPGIAIDTQDNAYITDFGTDTVRVFNAQHSQTNAYLVGDGPISIALFEPNPNGIALENQFPVESFTLFQNYPNPFNPETNLRFRIANVGMVQFVIYDLLGKKVKTLVNQQMVPGTYTLRWNGRNDSGRSVSSGVYVYRLKVGNHVQSRKMMLLR